MEFEIGVTYKRKNPAPRQGKVPYLFKANIFCKYSIPKTHQLVQRVSLSRYHDFTTQFLIPLHRTPYTFP